MAFSSSKAGRAASLGSAHMILRHDELHHWIGEGGASQGAEPARQDPRGIPRQDKRCRGPRQPGLWRSVCFRPRHPHLPHFGLVIATCERRRLRLSPDGITIHVSRYAGGRRRTGHRAAGPGDALDGCGPRSATAARVSRCRAGESYVETVAADPAVSQGASRDRLS